MGFNLRNHRKKTRRRRLPRLVAALGVALLVSTTIIPVAAQEYPGEPLRLGSRGEAVRVWQEALGISADGAFGEQTRAATIRWQVANGLVGDGIVGPASWRVMFPNAAVNADRVQITIDGAGHGHGVGLTQFGALGMAIEGYNQVQILEHFYQGTSVQSLASALPGSWVVTEPMPIWVGIRQNRSDLTFVVTAGQVRVCFDGDYDSYPVLVEGKTLERDNTFTDVVLTRLVELGYLQSVPGGFDGTVRDAVRSFQADQGLQADGAVGSSTWEALLSDSGLPECAGAYYLDAGERLAVTAAGGGSCSTNLVGTATECHLSIQGLTPANRVGLEGLRYGSNMTEFAHGNVRLRPSGNRIHFSMQLDIEDYVAGIAEVPAGWPDAALRAQAIAARSYAIYGMLRRGSGPSLSSARRSSCWCHVLSDSRDQVYAGWNREIQADGRWATVGARPTAGMVITHPQESETVVQAFYSASSGGATEDSSTLWGTAGRPYLVSVRDPWSIDPAVNPGAYWSKTVSLADLLEIFNLEGRFSEVVSVSTVPYPWGSAEHVKIVGIRGGTRVTERVSASTIKSSLRLRSRYFVIDYLAPGWSPPPAPTGVTVTGGTAATVRWDPVPARFDPGRYTVTVTPAHVDPVVVEGSQTEAVVTGLRRGVDYSFTVMATNQVGDGPPSAATSPRVVIAEQPYPGAPLRQGSRGEPVRLWQEALGVTADGDFGPATAAATRLWQEENGLNPDGIVGEQSWNKMFASPPEPESDPDPEPAPDPEPEAGTQPQSPTTDSGVPSYPGFLLRVGSQGKWVRTWQAALGVRADGYFGAATARATRQWQERNGLNPDGVVGLESWQTMFPGAGVEQPATPPDKNGSSDSGGDGNGSDGNVPSYPGTPLRVGSQGMDVIVWQRALGIAPDGDFGPATLVATKAWQYQQGLTADGTVDAESWGRMFAGAGTRQPSATDVDSREETVVAPTPVYPGQPLRRGSRGADVVTWQRAVGVTADGSFGPQTERATRNWQRDNGLAVNGIVDADDWREMFSGGSSGATNVARRSSVLLEEGDEGPRVQVWQEALNAKVKTANIEVDGVFSEDTVRYTKSWQRHEGIAASGRVTQAAWDRMFPEGSPPGGDAGSVIATSFPLQKDDSGPLVRRWQEALNANVPGANIAVTGEFDDDTDRNTKYWKRRNGVTPVDGRVTEANWYRMFPDER